MTDRKATSFESPLRAASVSVGAGCILFILALSVTGQISRYYPVVLSELSVYVISLGIAVILLCSIVLLRKAAVFWKLYSVLSVVAFALVAVWALLAIVLHGISAADFHGIGALLLVFEISRLVFTAFLGILWNLHMSLNRVAEAPQIASLTVLMATILYLLSLLLGEGSWVLAVCAGATSCVLLRFVAQKFTFQGDSAYSVQAVQRAQLHEPQPSEPVLKTRITFFSSRVLWHMVTTVFLVVSIGSLWPTYLEPLKIVLVVAVLVAGAGGVVFSRSGKASACFISIGLPFSIIALCYVGLGSGDFGSLNLVLVVLATYAWYMLFYVQLPSYRDITRMQPITYAFLERLIPLTAAYLARIIMSLGFPELWTGFMGERLTSVIVLLFAVCSVGLCVVVLVRHVVRYYPDTLPFYRSNRHDGAGDEGSRAVMQPLLDEIASQRELTPRETDVLYYLARGYSKPYIAKTLCVSLATVKTHTRGIYRKLGVGTHDELIDYVFSREASF